MLRKRLHYAMGNVLLQDDVVRPEKCRATYMRSMTTIFHDKEIKVYVADVIIKTKKATDHMEDLRKFFNRLRRYNLKLNPAKCVFGVPT